VRGYRRICAKEIRQIKFIMKKAGITIAICVFIMNGGFCQNNKSDGNFVYDPIFWKDKLGLNVAQCAKIRNIDFEFYSNITSETLGQTRTFEVSGLLKERNQKIWETFSSKQKRRWRKLEFSYTDSNSSKWSLSQLLKRQYSSVLAYRNRREDTHI
jgi:hypothetical protein